MTNYPANTVARATVMGVPGVIVFRREFLPGHFDWAFSPQPDKGLEYTCSTDREGLVKDVWPLWVPGLSNE